MSFQPKIKLSINTLHLEVSTDVIAQGQNGKVKGQINFNTMMLHTYTSNQCPYHVLTFYTLQFPRYSPDKGFNVFSLISLRNLLEICANTGSKQF